MPNFNVFHNIRYEHIHDSDERRAKRLKAFIDMTTGFGAADFPNLTFEHVATLNCLDMDEVFSRTNSVNDAWYADPTAGAVRQGIRSTSVGDLVQDEEGTFYICAAVGWKPVDNHVKIHILETESPSAEGEDLSM